MHIIYRADEIGYNDYLICEIFSRSRAGDWVRAATQPLHNQGFSMVFHMNRDVY